MISTRYGNEITPVEAVYDHETGNFVACFATRKIDNAKRFYTVGQIRATDGVAEILSALESLPKRADNEVLDCEAWR